jgi:hypothetical protein
MDPVMRQQKWTVDIAFATAVSIYPLFALSYLIIPVSSIKLLISTCYFIKMAFVD